MTYQESIVHMANTLYHEPMLASQTVRSVILAMQLRSLATGLNLGYLYPETLAEVEKFYQEPDDSEVMVRALAGDRCNSLAGQREAGIPDKRSPVDRVLEYFDPLGQSALRRAKINTQRGQLLESFAELMHLTDRTYQEQIAYIADLRENGTGYVKWVEHPRHPLNLPIKGLEHMPLNAVVARIGLLIVAIERYRSDCEELPRNLQRLVPDYIPEVPLDPYDGQPMRYVAQDQDYMLYSVYFDRVDDGGAPLEKTGESELKGDWRISIVQ
ncbi:MAG: hypothetical protein IT364_20690 [Candidatus Hydrogenedentes bacterium]|nr:hypothetical protein [Candidatus Hydrogenedentota bacterium]